MAEWHEAWRPKPSPMLGGGWSWFWNHGDQEVMLTAGCAIASDGLEIYDVESEEALVLEREPPISGDQLRHALRWMVGMEREPEVLHD